MCCDYIRVILVFCAVTSCVGQGLPSFQIGTFRQFIRTTMNAPLGRSVTLNDIMFRYYSNSTQLPKTYKIKDVKQLLKEPSFDMKRPTLLYAHGYVEKTSDESTLTVVRAYVTHGGYNILLLDWANLAYGNYINVALDVSATGKEAGKAMVELLKNGLSLEGLHFVGHSMGCHVLSAAARVLNTSGYRLPRLSGLDPAYPAFYLPIILVPSMTSSDASFVDVIHTDGGYFGSPTSTGHADFWPNRGQAKQPGCAATIPLSDVDFCSHWRSWAYWAESVTGGEFLARRCQNYDSYVRGQCQDSPRVYMGLRASPNLRGNFYLRTAGSEPYALGERGSD